MLCICFYHRNDRKETLKIYIHKFPNMIRTFNYYGHLKSVESNYTNPVAK